MSDETNNEQILKDGLATGKFFAIPQEEIDRLRKEAKQNFDLDSLDKIIEGKNPFEPQSNAMGTENFDTYIGHWHSREDRTDFSPCARGRCQQDGQRKVYLWYGNQCYAYYEFEKCDPQIEK